MPQSFLKRLDAIYPPDPTEDGTYGTDGSNEALRDVFEDAAEKAHTLAGEAILLVLQLAQSIRSRSNGLIDIHEDRRVYSKACAAVEIKE